MEFPFVQKRLQTWFDVGRSVAGSQRGPVGASGRPAGRSVAEGVGEVPSKQNETVLIKSHHKLLLARIHALRSVCWDSFYFFMVSYEHLPPLIFKGFGTYCVFCHDFVDESRPAVMRMRLYGRRARIKN